MKLIILILIFCPLVSQASQEVEEAKKSLEALIEPILQSTKKGQGHDPSGFRIDQCEKSKINWMNVLLLKEKATLKFHFAEGCDIQGTLAPTLFTTFPAHLVLRKLPSFNQLETENRITASIENKPVLNLAIRNGTLDGPKGKLLFEADYAVRLDPAKSKNMMDENLGGEIRIRELFGKKVEIREKILVK